MKLNTSTTSIAFENCDVCDKKMKEIIMPMSDMKAIREFEKNGRLCQQCTKKSKLNDDVITIDLKRRGLI